MQRPAAAGVEHLARHGEVTLPRLRGCQLRYKQQKYRYICSKTSHWFTRSVTCNKDTDFIGYICNAKILF